MKTMNYAMNSMIKTIFAASILLSPCPAQTTVKHARKIDKDREIAESNHNGYRLLFARLARAEYEILLLPVVINNNNIHGNFHLAMKQECDLLSARQDYQELQDEIFMANRVRAEMYPAQR